VKLGVRLALAMAVVAMVPLVVTGTLSARMAADQVSEGRRDGLALTANAHAAFVDTWIQGRVRSLDGWRDVYGGRWGDLDDAQRVGFLRQVYRSAGSAAVVALLDSKGEQLTEPVFLSDQSASSLERSPSEVLAYLAHAGDAVRRSRGQTVTGLYRGGDDVPMMSVILPLDAALGWNLAVQLSLDEAFRPLAEASASQQAVVLMGEDGKPFFGGEHALVSSEVLESLVGTDSSFRYRHAEEGFVYGETRPVEPSDWTMVVMEPASVLWAPAQSVVRSVAIVAALNLLMALLLARASANSLVRPILQLKQAARRVAEGDYDAVAPDTGGGEIADLAGSFQTMTEALAEQRQELSVFQSELQQRVEDRTASLRRASEELIERRERAALTSMGAGLAHELNNPLSSVLGISQLLRSSGERSPNAETMLEKLEHEANRCREIVHRMLQLTEHQDAAQSCTSFRLDELLEESVQQMRGPFAERAIPLRMTESAPCHVTGDRARWAAVLQAIFDALTGMVPGGSSLDVRTYPRDASAQIVWEVLDDGGDPCAQGVSANEEVMGYAVWVAREMAHRVGGAFERPDQDALRWRLSWVGEGDV